MASIQQTKTGWRAQLSVKGQRDSQVFPSKREAQVWAARRETELRTIAAGRGDEVYTLGDLFTRYAQEVSPGKRGGRWEVIRLKALPSTGGSLLKANTRLQSCSPALLAQWRDQRMTEVEKGTVLREMALLSAVFQKAVREWGWLRENPMKGIAKPARPAHRDKVLSRSELRAILRALRRTPGTASSRCAMAFLFALRTGMRAGEICGIRREHCHADHVTLPFTKNGSSRDVPLSRKAKRLLGKALNLNAEPVFGLNVGTLDTLFRRARDASGVVDVHFHDSRHWAATMMARKLPVVDLCRMFGWKSMSQALTYYNATATSIAALLDK